MKKLFYSLSILAFLLVFTACEERDQPFPEFNDIEHGAFARLLSRTGTFFLTDVDNSTINVAVEFYDENQGRDVASYSWTVRYIDKATGGAANVGPVEILNIPASQFSTNAATGLPSASFAFRLADVFTALGITVDDVAGGSTFRFAATLTMTNGKKFTSSNTDFNIQSSAPFAGLFGFDADLLCTSNLAGDIDFVTTMGVTGGGGPACPGEITGTISLTEVGVGEYTISDASLGVFPDCWADNPATGLTLVDACNIIRVDGGDQYGDAYTWTIVSVNGASMTINFENTYGDAGTSVLTRQDGANWPPLRN